VDGIGKEAVKRLLKHMERPDIPGGEIFRIPGKPVYRESVVHKE
jgi:DNA-binding LacI/PurR family transcriptional regulator